MPTAIAPGATQRTIPPSGEEILVSRTNGPIQEIAPGSLLQVTVRRSAHGDSGVFINGEFVQAAIPEDLHDGEKVLVRAVPTDGALVLRVTDPTRLKGDNLISQSFEQILRSLLPDLQFSNLKNSVLPAEPFPEELFKLLFAQKQSGETPAVSPRVAAILEKFLQGNLALNEEALSSPTELADKLQHMSNQSPLDLIQHLRADIEKLSDATPPPALVRLLKAVESHLRSLLKGESALDFETGSTDEKILSQQLKIYLLASQTAVESGNSAAIQSLTRGMESVRRLENPLAQILKVLKNIDEPAEQHTEATQQLREALKSTAGELDRLRAGKAGDKEIREAIPRILTKLTEALERNNLHARDAQPVEKLQKMLQNLEGVAQAQQALRQINPVMQAMGEPIFLIFPALMQGLLSSAQVTVRERRAIDEESEEGQRKGAGDPFTRVAVSLNLPSIGAVEIDLAHRKSEVLLALTTSSEEATKCILETMPKLERAFRALGYDKPKMSAVTGDPKPAVPQWYIELSRRSFVA